MKLRISPLLSTIALAAAACAPLVAKAQEVVIGIPIASSGIFAFANLPARNGIVLAQEEIEKSGELGKVKLKVLLEDTSSDKNQAVTLTNRFISTNKAVLILGATSTVEALAYLPIAQSKQIPVLTTASGDVTKVGDWIFKATAIPSKIVEGLAQRYYKDYKPKRAAYVFNRDNESYLEQKNGLKRPLESNGVTTVLEETIVGSDTDFSAIATKLAAADIDTLVISTTGETTANIILQAKQAGLSNKVRIVATPSAATHQFIKVGGPAVEGTIFAADYFIGNPGALNETFVAAYKKKYGIEPDNFAATGYSLFKTAAAAVKNAGPDYSPASIRQALANVKDLPSLLGAGLLTQTPARVPVYDGVVLTIKNGKIALL